MQQKVRKNNLILNVIVKCDFYVVKPNENTNPNSIDEMNKMYSDV